MSLISDTVLYVLDQKLNIYCNKDLISSIDSEIKADQVIQIFPLPANDEQRRIIQTLDRQKGVIVQGPPGTGRQKKRSHGL